MAKRFIDSNLFKKNFLRGLKAPYKLLWVYLFCDCSNAGIWEVDTEIASIYVDGKITIESMKQIFKERIVFFDNDTKIFIPDFISFQYGALSSTNPAHKGVIRDLEKYNFIDSDLTIKIKNLSSSFEGAIQGTQYMDKDKDKEKDKDIVAKFYKKELESNLNSKFYIAYKSFIDYLYGNNELKCEATHILKVKGQLSYEQFEKLKNKQNDLKPLLESMLNNPKYLKDKKSLYLTLNTWINNNEK